LQVLYELYGRQNPVWNVVNSFKLKGWCQGHQFSSLLAQMGQLAAKSRTFCRVLEKYFLDVRRRGEFSPGLIISLYFSLLQKAKNPALEVEAIFPGIKVFDHGGRRAMRTCDVTFDYYDTAQSTGHEIMWTPHVNPKLMPQRYRQRKVYQMRKYMAWLDQNPERKLEYHLLCNASFEILQMLSSQFGERYKERVVVNMYVPWDFEQPYKSYRLDELKPQELEVDFYKDISLQERDSEELLEQLEELVLDMDDHPDDIFYDEIDLLQALFALRSHFKVNLSELGWNSIASIFDTLLYQWHEMAQEELPIDIVGYHNSVMRMVLSQGSEFVRTNDIATLYRMMSMVQELEYDSRPFNLADEEYGMFAPLLVA